MVSVIQLALCVHVEWNSKQQNISFFHCHLYSTQRLERFENFKKVNSNVFNLNEKEQVNTSLHSSQTNHSVCAHQEILKFAIA